MARNGLTQLWPCRDPSRCAHSLWALMWMFPLDTTPRCRLVAGTLAGVAGEQKRGAYHGDEVWVVQQASDV